MSNTLSAFTGHVFKVWGSAANDRAQCNNRIDIAALSHGLADEWDFKGAWRSDNVELIFTYAMSLESIDGAFK